MVKEFQDRLLGDQGAKAALTLTRWEGVVFTAPKFEVEVGREEILIGLPYWECVDAIPFMERSRACHPPLPNIPSRSPTN